MKLYVCYGTFRLPHPHSCARAYEALTAAGHEPEVIRAYGCFRTDPLFRRRRAVKRLTSSYKVPVLVLDDGHVVTDSSRIVAWAQSHPARSIAHAG